MKPLPMKRSTRMLVCIAMLMISMGLGNKANGDSGKLLVGGYVQNIDPHQLPVPVNGGFVQQMADRIIDPLAARSLVIRSGDTTISLTVVDSCLLPRDLVDEAKQLASQATGTPVNRMMVSATHAHSVPAVQGIHGSEASPEYRLQLREQLAKSIIEAHARLQPAQVGWGRAELNQYVYCRRWLMQPGTATTIPFTGRDANQVQMNPGHANANKIRPVGPVDPEVIVLAFRNEEGKPLAGLGNFNTHYAGAPALSSDYFGHFCRKIGARLGADAESFVALMSNGTSGDANCIDFSQPENVPFDAAQVADAVMERADQIYRGITTWHDAVPLQMLQEELTLPVRMPADEEVAKAKEATASWLNERLPENMLENYARETILLHSLPPTRTVLLQTIALGDFAIATTPCEVYGSTGLGLKKNSPFPMTMNIGWANDYLGYLPPPEHFKLGGYTTWRARSSCLEEQAEPKIVERLLQMLQQMRALPSEANVKFSPLRDHPLTPQQSLQQLEIVPEYRVELVASEPIIRDPVSARFDEHGRLWVVEMPDYPTGPIDGASPQGAIKILEDRDQDGFFETGTTFADNLLFPTGLTHFRDGVIVTLAGRIMFLEDRDGDLVCDHREEWFQGFTEENEQLRANHPTWTLDGRIHVAGGLRGGLIQPQRDPWRPKKEPLSLAGADFEFSPFENVWQRAAGNSQFGFYQDLQGRKYVCSNRNPCQLVMASIDQIERNPLLPLNHWTVDVMPAAENSRILSLVNAFTTSNLHAGQFTAACGVYQHERFLPLTPIAYSKKVPQWVQLEPPAFFACEPTAGVIQSYRMVSNGLVPTAERAQPNREFIASRDPWFRPVDLFSGPDLGMYIVDMHRAVIEHPDWVPEEWKETISTRKGNDAGRIYRVVRSETTDYQPELFKSANPTIDDYVEALLSGTQWKRETAFRRLLELGHDGSNPVYREEIGATLRKALMNNKGSSQGWILGMRLLNCLQLDAEHLIETGLMHHDPWVVVQVIQFAEKGDPLKVLAMHESAIVRYHWLLACAPLIDVADAHLLILAVQGEGKDSPTEQHWLSQALAAAPSSLAVPALAAVTKEFRQSTSLDPLLGLWIERLGWAGDAETLEALLLARAAGKHENLSLLYLRGAARRGSGLEKLRQSLTANAIAELDRVQNEQVELAIDSQTEITKRLEAINLLALDRSRYQESFETLIRSDRTPAMLRALEIVGTNLDGAIVDDVLDDLESMPLRMANSLVETLVNREIFAASLVARVEQGELAVRWFSPTAWERLRRNPDPVLKERIEKLWQSNNNGDRAQLVKQYSTALSAITKPIDRERGKQLFAQHCASCHRIGDRGFAVGPDISDLRTATSDQLIQSILDPSAAIDANYFRCTIVTTDGYVWDGVLKGETATSVTLALQDGKMVTVARDEIEQLQPSRQSLMPVGFEQQLDPTAMRDLIDYLKNWRFQSLASGN